METEDAHGMSDEMKKNKFQDFSILKFMSIFSTKQFINSLLASALIIWLAGCNDSSINLRLGSGNAGGMYHKISEAFATQMNANNSTIKIQVKNTTGTEANIRLLEDGFLDLAIVQSDILKNILMRSRSRHVVSAVAGLYTESVQIVVRKDSDIKTFANLKGKKISIGEEESGVLRNAEIILQAYGIPTDAVEKFNFSFNDAAAALKAGSIDAFFCTAGVPTPSISALADETEIRLLSLDSSDINRITSLYPEFTVSDISANAYTGQDAPIQTIGVRAILVASILADSATIQKATENLFSKKIFAEALQIPTPQSATNHIPVAFHPGAAAFYKSKGIVVEQAAPVQGRNAAPSTGD